MPLAVGERRAAVGHPLSALQPQHPGAIWWGAAGLGGHVWLWIIVQWDTRPQTAGEQTPHSAAWGAACLKLSFQMDVDRECQGLRQS